MRVADVATRQSRGDDTHNLVTVAMKELGLELQESMDWITRFHDNHVRQFLEGYEKIVRELHEKDDPMNTDAMSYIESLGNWIRANDQWCFEGSPLRSVFCISILFLQYA
jgi:hypothetical protein